MIPDARNPSRVAPLAPVEVAEAIDLLARSFRDNPLNRAVVGTSAHRRMRANSHGMRATFSATAGHSRRLAIRSPREKGETQPIIAALLGFGPGSYPAPLPSAREQLLCLLGQGWRVMRRWSRVHEELSEIHPPARHCYLGLLGVRVDRQGQGLGAELLDAWLSEVDSLGLPAYLETDRERNVAFYSRAGFEVSATLSVLGVDIWCMRRPPFPARHEEAQEAAPESIPGEG